MRFQFFPPVEGDNVAAILTMPEGTSSQETLRAVHALESSAQRVRAEADVSSSSKGPSPTSVFRHTLSSIGQQPFFKTQQEGAGKFVPDVSNAHLGEVHVELVPSEERVGASSYQLASAWRDATQPIPGVESSNSPRPFFLLESRSICKSPGGTLPFWSRRAMNYKKYSRAIPV